MVTWMRSPRPSWPRTRPSSSNPWRWLEMDPAPDVQRGAAFRDGVAILKEAGIESPALDAAVLLGYVTGELPATVLLDRGSTLKPSETELYSALVQKRCSRVAVSRLVGA